MFSVYYDHTTTRRCTNSRLILRCDHKEGLKCDNQLKVREGPINQTNNGQITTLYSLGPSLETDGCVTRGGTRKTKKQENAPCNESNKKIISNKNNKQQQNQ